MSPVQNLAMEMSRALVFAAQAIHASCKSIITSISGKHLNGFLLVTVLLFGFYRLFTQYDGPVHAAPDVVEARACSATDSSQVIANEMRNDAEDKTHAVVIDTSPQPTVSGCDVSNYTNSDAPSWPTIAQRPAKNAVLGVQRRKRRPLQYNQREMRFQAQIIQLGRAIRMEQKNRKPERPTQERGPEELGKQLAELALANADCNARVQEANARLSAVDTVHTRLVKVEQSRDKMLRLYNGQRATSLDLKRRLERAQDTGCKVTARNRRLRDHDRTIITMREDQIVLLRDRATTAERRESRARQQAESFRSDLTTAKRERDALQRQLVTRQKSIDTAQQMYKDQLAANEALQGELRAVQQNTRRAASQAKKKHEDDQATIKALKDRRKYDADHTEKILKKMVADYEQSQQCARIAEEKAERAVCDAKKQGAEDLAYFNGLKVELELAKQARRVKSEGPIIDRTAEAEKQVHAPRSSHRSLSGDPGSVGPIIKLTKRQAERLEPLAEQNRRHLQDLSAQYLATTAKVKLPSVPNPAV